MAAEIFCFSLFLVMTLTSSALPLTASIPAKAPAAAVNNSTEFIRTSCGATLYPDLCFTSLARYASSVQQNPIQLARAAAKVTFAQIHSASAHVSAHLSASTGREAAALEDCMDSLGDAADQTRKSAAEIGKLEAAVGPEVAWRVSNVQTWMSAALTNEETCTDGFDGVGPDDRVKTDVFGRVGQVKEYTSNALALVNTLVNSSR